MLIKTRTGQTIDTDKLGDVPAAVFEKMQDINAFFTSLNVPYILRFIAHDGKASGTTYTGHPTFDAAKVTDLLMGQCATYIERHLPGYKIALVPKKPGSDLPAAS